MSKPAPRPIADLTSPQLLARGPALQGRAAAAGGVMTDSEIIALAWRYYKAGRASTAEADGIPTRDEFDCESPRSRDPCRLRGASARRSRPAHPRDGAARDDRNRAGQDGSAPHFPSVGSR